jgi:hypothetical protein
MLATQTFHLDHGQSAPQVDNKFLVRYFGDRGFSDIHLDEEIQSKDQEFSVPQDSQSPVPLHNAGSNVSVVTRNSQPGEVDSACERCRQFGKECEWNDHYLACNQCRRSHRRCSGKQFRRTQYWADRSQGVWFTAAEQPSVPGL